MARLTSCTAVGPLVAPRKLPAASLFIAPAPAARSLLQRAPFLTCAVSSNAASIFYNYRHAPPYLSMWFGDPPPFERFEQPVNSYGYVEWASPDQDLPIRLIGRDLRRRCRSMEEVADAYELEALRLRELAEAGYVPYAGFAAVPKELNIKAFCDGEWLYLYGFGYAQPEDRGTVVQMELLGKEHIKGLDNNAVIAKACGIRDKVAAAWRAAQPEPRNSAFFYEPEC